MVVYENLTNKRKIPPPAQTSKILEDIGECIEASSQFPVVSDKPISTMGLFYCRGIVIHSPKRTGVLHIGHHIGLNESGILDIIKELRVPASELQAMLIEADYKYHFDVRAYFKDQGINLTGYYASDIIPPCGIESTTHEKDLFVIPHLRKVIICVQNQSIIKKFKH